MKKFALYMVGILSLFVLLVAINYTEFTYPSTESLSGNTSGNILNCGNAAEDDEYVYFWKMDSKRMLYDYSLYKASKSNDTIEEIAKSMHGVSYINVSDEFVFYSDAYLGHIKRVRKDGTDNRHVSFVRVTDFIVNGERIYYRKADFKKPRQAIYSMDFNGKKVRLLAKGVFMFCVDKNTIYYINAWDNNTIWKMDIFGRNKKKLFEETVSELLFDEKYIYCVSYPERRLYRADKKTLESELVIDESVRGINVTDEWIYFSKFDENDRLYRVSKDVKIKEKVLDLPTLETNVVGDNIFFRRLEDGFHWYHLDIETQELAKLSE